MKNKLVLLLAIIYTLPLLLCSCYSEPEPMYYCRGCKTEFPEKYKVLGFHDDFICPRCADEQIRSIVSEKYIFCQECNKYEVNGMMNMCDVCDLNLVVECFNCTNFTYRWYDDSDFVLCGDCMVELLKDDQLNQHLRSFIE